MSYCPRPDKTSKTNLGATVAKKKVNAPPFRGEECGKSVSSVVSGGGTSTSNTVYVTGPAGAPGPMGPAGKDGEPGKAAWGFKWEGEWEVGKEYKKQSDENPLASVVYYNGASYVALNDNKSTNEENPEFRPDRSISWSLLSQKGEFKEEEKGFFETLQDDIFDWIKKASIGELIAAGVGVAGVVWAGNEVVKMIVDDGEGDGEAAAQYNGTLGYVTTNYVPPKVADIVANLCAVADNVTVDVSRIADEPCEFVIGNVTQIRTVLDQLSLAFQFEMVDTGGVLKFVARSTTPVKVINSDDMGFGNSGPVAPYVSKRYQGITLPKRVTITYTSPDVDYNAVTQSADFHTFEEGQIVQLQVPVTLSHVKAKQIAEVSLSNAHLEARNYSWSASYRDIDLEPSDVVEHSKLGLIRITVVQETSEGLLQFTGVDAGAPQALEISNNDVFLPPVSTNVAPVIGYSQAFFIDPPNLNSSDTGIRIYAAVHGYDVVGWPGADIYVSENGGASYELVDSSTRESTLGLVEIPVAAHDYHTWDNDTTIVVKLKTNSLLSVSDIDVLNGKNWAMIGQEMIGFANATLIAEKTYRLSRLLRGRQGTEHFVGTHQANELFCLLDDTLVPIEWEKEDRMSVKRYKVVTRGSSLDKVDGMDVQMVSNNTLMWTPLNVKVTRSGPDYVFSWNERARYNNALKDFSSASRDPDWGGTGIIIYDTDGVTPKGRHTTTGETFTYTLAMQVADFGFGIDTIKAAVAQLSQIYGAGSPVLVSA